MSQRSAANIYGQHTVKERRFVSRNASRPPGWPVDCVRPGHRGDGDAALFKNDTVGTTCSYEVIVKITGPGQRSSIAVALVADSLRKR